MLQNHIISKEGSFKKFAPELFGNENMRRIIRSFGNTLQATHQKFFLSWSAPEPNFSQFILVPKWKYFDYFPNKSMLCIKTFTLHEKIIIANWLSKPLSWSIAFWDKWIPISWGCFEAPLSSYHASLAPRCLKMGPNEAFTPQLCLQEEKSFSSKLWFLALKKWLILTPPLHGSESPSLVIKD